MESNQQRTKEESQSNIDVSSSFNEDMEDLKNDQQDGNPKSQALEQNKQMLQQNQITLEQNKIYNISILILPSRTSVNFPSPDNTVQHLKFAILDKKNFQKLSLSPSLYDDFSIEAMQIYQEQNGKMIHLQNDDSKLSEGTLVFIYLPKKTESQWLDYCYNGSIKSKIKLQSNISLDRQLEQMLKSYKPQQKEEEEEKGTQQSQNVYTIEQLIENINNRIRGYGGGDQAYNGEFQISTFVLEILDFLVKKNPELFINAQFPYTLGKKTVIPDFEIKQYNQRKSVLLIEVKQPYQFDVAKKVYNLRTGFKAEATKQNWKQLRQYCLYSKNLSRIGVYTNYFDWHFTKYKGEEEFLFCRQYYAPPKLLARVQEGYKMEPFVLENKYIEWNPFEMSKSVMISIIDEHRNLIPTEVEKLLFLLSQVISVNQQL